MNGVPATLGPLCVTSLLDEHYTCKPMVQVPKVDTAHTTLKVPEQEQHKFIIVNFVYVVLRTHNKIE